MDSPEIPARRHFSDRSKPKSYHTAQVRHYSAPAQGLNHVIPGSTDDSKKNMVQGWLSNIQALGAGVIAGDPTHQAPNNSKHLPWPQSLLPARQASHTVLRSGDSGFTNPMSQPGGDRRHERPRASFNRRDDSSIIVPRNIAVGPRIRPLRFNPAAGPSYHESGKNRRQPSPDAEENGSALGPSPPTHNFEKRARHKTKSDRYDAVKNAVASQEKKRKKRQEEAAADSKKDRMKRNHLASERDVMDNFNSHSILSDRITIPPSSRPGLFDNGRISKKPVSDLMSNSMSFLKQPRRESQKPSSRRRESDARRGERERDDISAFFLHNSLSDRYDMQGRKQVDESVFPSPHGKTSDDFFIGPERRHALNPYRPLSDKDHGQVQSHESSPRVDRGQIKPNRHISGTCRRPSTGREPSVSDSHTLSSTPVRIREALIRSGIFDNTSISCDNSHGHHMLESGKGGLASAKSTSMNQTLGKHAQPEPIRIVRYQDRGTMAEATVTGPDDHDNHLSMQNRFPIPRDEPLDNARSQLSVDLSCAKIPVSEASISTTSHSKKWGDQARRQDEGSSCSQMAPERPRSPKCAVVERLQAAVEYVRPSSCPPATPAIAQMNRHSSWSLLGNRIHSPSEAQAVSTRSFLFVPSSGDDANRLAPHLIVRRFQRESTLLEPPTPWCSMPIRATAGRISPSRDVWQTQSPAVPHFPDQTSGAVPSKVQSQSVTARLASTQHNQSYGVHQSMQDYIVELERQILDQMGSGEDSGISSSKEVDFMLNSDLPEVDIDVEHANAYIQSPEGLSGPYLDQAPRSASPHNWTVVAELEKDEEQRFMASFWRPNGYPI